MPKIKVSDEELEILKDLTERWLNELRFSVSTVDEMPEPMRPEAYQELDYAIDKAEILCEVLGVK